MRIDIGTDLISRDGSVAKDAKLLNAFTEDSAVIKRPATASPFATSSGQAQGGIANNSLVFMINADVVKSYNAAGALQQTINL